MFKKVAATILVLLLATSMGCYNTYNITLDEMAKAQEGGGAAAVKVTTSEGEDVVVTETTKIGVMDTEGGYHAVSPFNFILTRGQLVAPDEDLLLNRSEISTGNVKLVSGGKTAALVISGVVALAGLGAFVALTAPEKKGFGQE